MSERNHTVDTYQAFDTLLSRMSGAPNIADYRSWLLKQPADLLVDLAEGRPVRLRQSTRWTNVRRAPLCPPDPKTE